MVGLSVFLKELDSAHNCRIQEENGFENIKCLERFFQIEPYDKYGYIQPPYKRTSITYDRYWRRLEFARLTVIKDN